MFLRVKENNEPSTIAVVNDDDEINALLTRVYEDAGYRVVSAHEYDFRLGSLGMRQFLEGNDARTLVWDIGTPNEGDAEFYRNTIRPNLVEGCCLILTCTDLKLARKYLDETENILIEEEPFHIETMLKRARECQKRMGAKEREG